jgi:uncharacterized membrane protein (DUF2068 family)
MNRPEPKPAVAETPVSPLPKKRAPTLYAIIWVKLLKGALFLALAFVAYALSDNDLPAEYAKWLHLLRIHPERRFWSDLAVRVAQLTEAKVLAVALGTFVYSLFSLVEGVGLLLRVRWAGWLAIGESAFFIPIEIADLTHHLSRMVSFILVGNVIIVWYLYQNRKRLFGHYRS